LDETSITLNLVDVTAKNDSAPSATDIQPFASADQLKRENLSVPSYATLEDNLFLLDGSFSEFPDAPIGMDFGYWSKSMSGSDGSFVTPPVLPIPFSKQHTSAGLTLHFIDDYPDKVSIQWFTLGGVLLSIKDFFPDGLDYFCDNPVEDYEQIVITFQHTVHPYRYIKLLPPDYGEFLTYSGDAVVDANIVEEVDPISNALSINTFNFTLHSPNGDFNLMNPQGKFKMLQQGQEAVVRQNARSGLIKMGTFRLDTWKSSDASTGVFTSIGSVGGLEKTDFKDGQIYINVPAGDIIDTIMASAGWTDYTIEDEIRSVPLLGWLAIQTHRSALQQVAFAAGAIVDDSRGRTIRIYSAPATYGHLIPRSRKFSGGSVMLLSYVSDITLTAHNYVLSTDPEQLYDGTLDAGMHEIQFSSPAANLSITGGTISEAHANYAVVNVAAAGEVIIMGQTYTDQTGVYTCAAEKLPGGATRSVEKFENATLVSAANAAVVAKRIYDYYQLRYSTSASIILDQERAGEKVALQHSDGTGYTMDTITKMSIDLVGGFLADVTCIGNGVDIVMAYYTGDLYAGQDMGVM
jgi:hypothetical protein